MSLPVMLMSGGAHGHVEELQCNMKILSIDSFVDATALLAVELSRKNLLLLHFSFD